MTILAINTAFPACNIALARDGTLLAERYEPMVRGQDARLAGLVDETLIEAGLVMSDLTRIAVVTGPGSFTGVRVGVAFARGLALVLKVHCVGLTSLEAAVSIDQKGDVLATLPAQKRPPELTYWAQHISDRVGLVPPEELSSEALETRLKALGIAQFSDGKPETMAATAALKAAALNPADHPPVPAYVRLPDAVPMAAR